MSIRQYQYNVSSKLPDHHSADCKADDTGQDIYNTTRRKKKEKLLLWRSSVDAEYILVGFEIKGKTRGDLRVARM